MFGKLYIFYRGKDISQKKHGKGEEVIMFLSNKCWICIILMKQTEFIASQLVMPLLAVNIKGLSIK